MRGSLPGAPCPVCGRQTAIRKNGKVYRHKSLRRQYRVVHGITVPYDFCSGSGKEAKK